MAKMLRTDFMRREAYDPEELRVALLTDDEYQAELDKEQAEADAYAAKES